jgi:hypothetical protein
MIPFKKLISIIRSMTNVEFDMYGLLTGDLFISNKEDVNILIKQSLLSDGNPIVCLDYENIYEIEIGKTIRLEFPCLAMGYGLIFKNFDDFLKFPQVHIKEPYRYYILDLDYLYSETPTDIFVKYRSVIGFVSALKKYLKFVDDCDDMDEVFTFFIVCPEEEPNLIKFHIPIKFTQDDLNKVDPYILNELSKVLVERFSEKHFSDSVLGIILEMTKDSKNPFAYLLEKSTMLLNGGFCKGKNNANI